MTSATDGAAGERSVAPSVLVHAPDLMDRSRISAAVPAARFVGSAAALVGSVGANSDEDVLVILDLARAGAVAAIAALVAMRVGRVGGLRVIGFGSHVDEDLLASARQAGADEVLARSVFFRRLGDLGNDH